MGFVEVRTYLTMVKKNELVLSNGLAMIDISIFALRVEIGGYFKKGIRGMTIRIWRGRGGGRRRLLWNVNGFASDGCE